MCGSPRATSQICSQEAAFLAADPPIKPQQLGGRQDRRAHHLFYPPTPSLHITHRIPNMFPTLLSVIAAVAALVHAQSLNVVNSCPHPVFLYTQSSFGTIDNNVAVAAGQSANLHISSNWDGAVNVGKSPSCVLLSSNARSSDHGLWIYVQELAAMLKVLHAPLVVQLGMVVHPSRGPNSTGYASVYMWLSSRPYSLFYRASGRFRES